MRVVTLDAVRRRKRLVVVRLLQRRVAGVMAVEAQRRDSFAEVVVELQLAPLSRLVHHVTGVASHVERGVAAAGGGHVLALAMALQAEVLALPARERFEQLVLVGRRVGIVTSGAVAHRRRVDAALDLGGVLVAVALQAERHRGGGGQLDPGDAPVDPDLMAGGAAHRHRRMDRLSLGLVLMTLEAGGGIRFRVKGDWVHGGVSGTGKAKNHSNDENEC